METVQIYFKQFRDYDVPLFVYSNVLPVCFIHVYRLSNIMWDVANKTAPNKITSSFLKIRRVYNYTTRSSSNDDFYIKHSDLEKVKNSFLKIGPLVWTSQLP